MKLTINDHVVDVAFNPAGRNDGRPDAGASYTASLRVDSTDGSAKLTVGTDFTPPAVLAALPEWSTSLAFSVLVELGFYGPANDRWMVAREGVYAFVDGVTYVEPSPDDLEFMASFGFTPGVRFNLALPMLRAQRAQWLTAIHNAGDPDLVVVLTPDSNLIVDEVDGAGEVDGGVKLTLDVALTTMAGVDNSGNALEFAMAEEAAECPEVGGAGVPMESAAAPATPLPESKRRRRTAAKPVGKVEIVSQALGEATEESFVDPAIVDVLDTLNQAAAPADDEVNPFAIEGL
jgi:hypothetical protein